jgi:hypothetical protein
MNRAAGFVIALRTTRVRQPERTARPTHSSLPRFPPVPG